MLTKLRWFRSKDFYVFSYVKYNIVKTSRYYFMVTVMSVMVMMNPVKRFSQMKRRQTLFMVPEVLSVILRYLAILTAYTNPAMPTIALGIFCVSRIVDAVT